MIIPWPKSPIELPSENGWQDSLRRAAMPLLAKSKLVVHVGGRRGETTRDILNSFDGQVLACDPHWPGKFHAVRFFFSTCWKFQDRVSAFRGSPEELIEWTTRQVGPPDLIVINGDVGEKFPRLVPFVMDLLGPKPMCGTEIAKMNPFLQPFFHEIETFDGFSWRVNADLLEEKWACPKDGSVPESSGWIQASANEAVRLMEKGAVVLFCRSFGRMTTDELSRWHAEFHESGYDVSICPSHECFLAKGSRMSKYLDAGWTMDIKKRCYEADALIHLRI